MIFVVYLYGITKSEMSDREQFISSSSVKKHGRTEYYKMLEKARQGELIQVRRGVYATSEQLSGNMIDINSIVPDGILCLWSAWSIHRLTTSMPQAFHIAVRRNKKITVPAFPQMEIHYYTDKVLNVGVSQMTIDGFSVNVYDVERCVCDAVKFRNKVGMDVCSEIIGLCENSKGVRHPGEISGGQTMSKEIVKNYGKSIRSKLLNIAKNEDVYYQTVLTRYFQERLIYRISLSGYRQNFYLKGGALMYAHEGFAARPTLDIDFLGNNISNDGERIVAAFREICSCPCEEDAVVFDVEHITSKNITELKDYHGVRLSIPVSMDTVAQVLTMDIGFGDIVTPAPVDLDYPALLEHLPRASILAPMYCRKPLQELLKTGTRPMTLTRCSSGTTSGPIRRWRQGGAHLSKRSRVSQTFSFLK